MAARHHDSHVNTTLARFDERVDGRLIGNEVRIGDVNRPASANDWQIVHEANCGRTTFWRAHHRLHRKP
jgi:hypothetical protein